MKPQDWARFGAVVVIFATVTIIDLAVYPGHHLATLLVLPLALAALWLPPRQLAAVSILSILEAILSAYLAFGPLEIRLLRFFGVIFLAFLGLLLAERRERSLELARAAHRERQRIRTIVDSMVDAVFFADAQGRLALTNDAGAALLGMHGLDEQKPSISSLTERLAMRHLDGTPMAPVDTPLARALAGETIRMRDVLLHNAQADRDLCVRLSAAPIRDDGNIVGAVAVAKDVTELIEVDRMKDDFIRVAAHELKTPVAIVKGYAQALARAGPVTEQQQKMLDSIGRGADRVNRIVEDLLDISQLRLDHPELREEWVELAEIVRSVVARMAPTALKHNLRLMRTEPVVVWGDPQRLERVIAQLIENAIKYSPQGGNVDVSIEARDGQAVVSVRDYGVGIPKEKQAHIFERFYRAHTGTPYDFGGMGTGLYIAREIVRAHGGRMWFESQEGKGSTFFFTLRLKTKGI